MAKCLLDVDEDVLRLILRLHILNEDQADTVN